MYVYTYIYIYTIHVFRFFTSGAPIHPSSEAVAEEGRVRLLVEALKLLREVQSKIEP